MSYEPQSKNQPAQKAPSSNQGMDDDKNAETSKTGFNKDKSEPRTGGMQDEANPAKPSQGTPKPPSNA